MSDVVKIQLYVGTGFANCHHKDVVEVPREEWDSLSEEQRNEMLDEMAVEFRNNYIDCSAWVIDEEDDE